jgi:CheY-like chemotaxis protein
MLSQRFFGMMPPVPAGTERFIMGLFGRRKRTKVLVADDVVADRRALSGFMEGRGCDVVEAGDGGPAVNLAVKELPDLILLGNNLQLLSGETVVAILRSDPRTQRIPIIIVSSNDKVANVERCLSQGANDYVVKPFDADRLLAKIERLIPQD